MDPLPVYLFSLLCKRFFFLDFLFVASSFTKSHELYTTRCQNHSSSLPASTVKKPFLSGTMLPKIQLGRAHLYASVFFLYSVLQNGHNVGWPELKHSSWNKSWLWGWKLYSERIKQKVWALVPTDPMKLYQSKPSIYLWTSFKGEK